LLAACGGISGNAASIAPSVSHAASISELSALEWRNVRYWHKVDIRLCTAQVRSPGVKRTSRRRDWVNAEFEI
ncbi:MAG: hypothetical protein WBE94_04385, partial [Pseudolabrys sp.]